MESWAARYDIDPTKVVAWIDIPWRPDDRVCVLPFCLIQGGWCSAIVTRSLWRST